MTQSPVQKRRLALLIPAHDEQLVIADSIRSAITAGISRQDIFVVSDGSSDWTTDLAGLLLEDGHVLAQPQTGKGMAIANGIAYFHLVERYDWVHITDADGIFSVTYFRELKTHLNRRYVAATGHVQSLKGGWISKYRTFEYTLGLEVMRRIQALLGAIPVIPGATCAIRTDIVGALDFTQPLLTEDMDVTLQIHRLKLGRIAYVPAAKAFTQDPKDFGDYWRQILRWYRGGWQVIGRHRLGLRPHKIDAYMGWMIIQEIILLLELSVFPLWSWWGQNYGPIAVMFLIDLIVVFCITIWAAALNRRPDIISAFPLFYVLRFVNLIAFFYSWFEIVVQHKFRSDSAAWSTAGRRYRIAIDGVADN
jgi:poly-beta-1,6-N-acetyl-D-glucosamine synthase